MNIIRINTDNTMIEVNVKKNWINTIKKANQSNNINLLFEWLIDNDSKLLLYGNLDGNQINNHILPNNGISSIDLNITSTNSTLYDYIYIVKLTNNKITNLSIQEYGEFYIMNYEYNSDYSSDDNDIDYNNNISNLIYYDSNNNNTLNYDNNIY